MPGSVGVVRRWFSVLVVRVNIRRGGGRLSC